MTEEFKGWLCERARYMFFPENGIALDRRILALLIKAMWAINREKGKYRIKQNIFNDYYVGDYSKRPVEYVEFAKEDHNNSEQQALQAALEYVFEQEGK